MEVASTYEIRQVSEKFVTIKLTEEEARTLQVVVSHAPSTAGDTIDTLATRLRQEVGINNDW